MRRQLKAALVLTTALGVAAPALSQSNPFSGLFGRDDPADGTPVDLTITSDSEIESRVRNASLIVAALEEKRFSGQDLLAAARSDYSQLLSAAYDEGYYSTVISILLDGVEAAQIAPLDAPDVITTVEIRVETGQRFEFSRADIAPVAPESEIPEEYAVGETAGTGVIRAAAREGVSGWRNYGHAKARVADQSLVADHDTNTVEAQIALEPGRIISFGQMNVSGQERMKIRRLRKIAGFPEGERFDPESLELVRKRLRRTGVFSAITLTESDNIGPDGSMDVDLAVVEQKTRRIGAGFELSNINGAQVSAYWMHRNLFGGAERLRVDGELSDIGSSVSGVDYSIGVRIDRPATLTPDTTAFIETTADWEDEEDYEQEEYSIGLGLSHIFSERLEGDTELEYRYSEVTDANGVKEFQQIALPSSITWDKRDVPTDPKRGYWLSADATPYVGLKDTGSGLRVQGEARTYYSLGAEDKYTIAGRVIAGTIAGSDIEETPRDYLFYSGGGGTVRGHPYESLGVSVIPGPDEAIRTGGMSIATLSAEFRWQFREKIGLVAFADYGEVWADTGFEGGSGDHSGAGVGVRYATPIGPLRFDVAGPVSGDTSDGVQVYLGLGQAF